MPLVPARSATLTVEDVPRLMEEAQTHLAAGAPREVERLFLLAYAVTHKSARFHALVGEALDRLGEHGRAEEYLCMAAFLAPSDPQWWLGLARFLEARGRADGAEAAARRALGASPYAHEAWDVVERAIRAQGRTPPPRLIVFGDSHAMYFRYRAAMDGPGGTHGHLLEVHDIGGATAYGLANPESGSGSGAVIRRRLKARPVYARLLFFFGEVDCRRAAWAAAAKLGRPIDWVIEDAVARYIGFIDALAAEGHGPISVVGPILPVTDDARLADVVRNDPRVTMVSQAERTRVTDRFHALARLACAERGWGWMDIAGAMRDPATGLAAATFTGDDPWDAHARMDVTAACLAEALGRHLEAVR